MLFRTRLMQRQLFQTSCSVWKIGWLAGNLDVKIRLQ